MKKALNNSIKAIMAAVLTLSMASAVSAADVAGLESAIDNGIGTLNTVIDISKYNVTTDQAMDFYLDMVDSNPDYFYVNNSVECTYMTDTGYAKELVVSYAGSNSEIQAQKDSFDKAANEALSTVNSSMTITEKLTAIHDYFINNYSYDFSHTSYTAYDLFVNKTGTCNAFSLGFKYACEKLGVPCEIVVSEGMNHAWNIVTVDGVKLHVDLAWDDNLTDDLGSMSYENFLKTDEEIQLSGHYGWQ